MDLSNRPLVAQRIPVMHWLGSYAKMSAPNGFVENKTELPATVGSSFLLDIETTADIVQVTGIQDLSNSSSNSTELYNEFVIQKSSGDTVTFLR